MIPAPRPSTPPSAGSTSDIGADLPLPADIDIHAEGGDPSALILRHTPGRGASPLPVALAARARTWRHGIVVVGDPTTADAVQEALDAGAGGYLFERRPQPFTPPARPATRRSPLADADDEPGSRDHMDQPAPTARTVTVMNAKGQPCMLSHREVEILHHVADGETNTRIARSLGISPHTIKSHLRRTGHRLTTNNRSEMILLAMRAGVIH